MKIQLIAVLIASALCLQGAVAARAATCVSAGAAGSAEGAKKRNKREKTVEAGVRVFTIKAKIRATDEDRAAAQETPRLNVRLVWGTMAEAAGQSGFEAIETRLAEKLREVFPWTSYYKILDKNLNTPEDKNITETLSPKARLQVRNLGRARFRLRLFGEGNRVINKTLTVDVDDIVALAGYDEHKMGWFVVLKRAPADDESSWQALLPSRSIQVSEPLSRLEGSSPLLDNSRMKFTELNHIALHVEDVEPSCDFYERVLKLEKIARPAFNFPGAWYQLGETQELHLIGKRDLPVHSHSRGTHWALMVDDMDAWESFLQEIGQDYLPRRTRPDGAHQIYVEDPDGHMIEFCTPPGTADPE